MTLPASHSEPLDGGDRLDLQPISGPTGTADRVGASPSVLGFAAEIADIFLSALNVDPPAPDVDLIAMGLLDSLSIVGLITALESRYRVRIPLDQVHLERIRTVGGIQTLLEELKTQHAGADSAILSLVRPGSGRPVFLLHTSWGRVQKELPHVLETDRPLYAFRAEFLRPDAEAPPTLERLAASYVRELRVVQPDGPYALVGFSFGGLLAYEMAVQLVRDGRRVDLLGLIDAEADVAVLTTRQRSVFEGRLALYRLLRRLNPARLGVDLKGLVVRSVRPGHIDDPAPRTRLTEEIQRSIEISQALGTRYRPGPYSGDAVLLVAAKRLPWEVDPRQIWSHRVRGTLATVTIPGGHSAMTDASWECVSAALKPLLA